MDLLDAFELEAKDLGALLAGLDAEEWDRPTRCAGWTVKDIAAHCENMLVRLVGEHAQEAEGEPEIDRAGYYAYDPDGPREDEPGKSFSEAIRDRVVSETGGRAAKEVLASYEAAAAAAVDGVREVPLDRVIERRNHPRITFGEFVATRVLELGIHSMDIGHGTKRGERIHPAAVPIVKGIIEARLGAELPPNLGWDDRTLILTGSGRRALLSNERYVLGPLAERFPVLR